MRARAVVLAAAILLTPLGVRAADLVIWWQKGFYPEEDRAVTELIAAYEQRAGKAVELVFVPQWEIEGEIEAALAAGRPPDLTYGGSCCTRVDRWAAADALTDLSDVVLAVEDRFVPGLIDHILLPRPRSSERVPYSVPLGQSGHYIHVWTSLLERAGFMLSDIPRRWEAFWSFWCEEVQPAVREATGRDDIWGTGLAMSADATDTFDGIEQFMIANSAYLSGETLWLLDDPTFRRDLIRSLAEYTAPWRQGCVPPDAVTWRNPDNNEAFLAQRVVMTVNSSLSIPAALREDRPDDYHRNTATIDWPKGPDGRVYPLLVIYSEAVVFRQGQNVETAKDFLRFVLAESRLGAWVEAGQGRSLPTMTEPLGSAFWVDPSDPHRRLAVEQLAVPSIPIWGSARMWRPRWDKLGSNQLLAQTVHRVAADGLTPEQAIDEMIMRTKQAMNE